MAQHRLRMTTSVLPWRPAVVKQASRVQHLAKMSADAAAFVQKMNGNHVYDYFCAEYSRKDITEKAWSEVARMNWKG